MSEHPDGQLRNLLGYIGVIRAEMRMQNWDILLHREPLTEEDVWATTWQQHNHTSLNVQVAEGLYDRDPWIVRNTLVHELVHAQHRDISRLWEDCTQNNADIAQSEAKSWDGDFHVFMERFVSWITQRIEQAIPLWDPEESYVALEGCFIHEKDQLPGH